MEPVTAQSFTTEALAIGVGIVIYLAKAWLASKSIKKAENAETIQTIILEAIAHSRTIPDKGVIITPELGAQLKARAISFVQTEVNNNENVQKIVKKLKLNLTEEEIGKYVELGIHAAKMGLDNVIKNSIKK